MVAECGRAHDSADHVGLGAPAPVRSADALRHPHAARSLHADSSGLQRASALLANLRQLNRHTSFQRTHSLTRNSVRARTGSFSRGSVRGPLPLPAVYASRTAAPNRSAQTALQAIRLPRSAAGTGDTGARVQTVRSSGDWGLEGTTATNSFAGAGENISAFYLESDPAPYQTAKTSSFRPASMQRTMVRHGSAKERALIARRSMLLLSTRWRCLIRPPNSVCRMPTRGCALNIRSVDATLNVPAELVCPALPAASTELPCRCPRSTSEVSHCLLLVRR